MRGWGIMFERGGGWEGGKGGVLFEGYQWKGGGVRYCEELALFASWVCYLGIYMHWFRDRIEL